ncbi:MAG: hypothetical protein AAB588_05340 [Patescibacteria group bacterium]
MQNKNLKNWILGSVMTLMIVGGTASYAAQSQKLFLGLEPLDVSQAQASVLTADEEPLTQPQQSETAFESAEVEVVAAPELIPTEEYFAEQVQENFIAEAQTPTVVTPSAPCPEGMIPIIQNTKVMGCHWPEIPSPHSTAKIQIISSN